VDTAEFLFPSDLAVTETAVGKILVIGSCMSQMTCAAFRAIAPQVAFEHVLFNNVMDMPDLDDATLRACDLQYVQLPLRHVLSDDVIDFSRFLADGVAEAVYQRAKQVLPLMLDAAMKYNKSHRLPTLVANFLVPQVPVVAALDQTGSARDVAAIVRRLNDDLAALVGRYRDAAIADVDAIAAAVGKSRCQDDSVVFYAHAAIWGPQFHDYDTAPFYNAPPAGRLDPLPRIEQVYDCRDGEMYRAMWRQIEAVLRIRRQTDMVKLVIFDLDDTLWRGLIGEHYADDMAPPTLNGWPTGLWEAVQHLRARGIIVAICSKNEESLVRKRWKNAVPLPWLTLDDFPLRAIDWNPKAANVAAIISQASVTPRSTVFVDDNPVEREAVRAALPGIRVIGSNPHVTRRILLWSPETQLATRSAESAGREQSIRTMQARESDRAALSREEFLRSLGCQVTIREVAGAADRDYRRAVELLNKTNQFNTTGVRWTPVQIEALCGVGGRVFIFGVTDKYTDYGIVGVILYRAGIFVQFVMSCRVLGLEIETSVIHAIMAAMRRDAAEGEFFARVIETDANMVCRDVFARCGFVRVAEGGTVYRWPDAPLPPPAAHLTFAGLDPAAAPLAA
jgi:FkbH-like protein